jgi:hypothetical protein
MTNEDHPYLNLNIGQVGQYTMTVPIKDSQRWLDEGWLVHPDRERLFMHHAKPNTITLMNRPKSLLEEGINRLVGTRLTGYERHLGTYGPSGLGFFGLLLEPEKDKGYREFLVYGIRSSGEYSILDNRVIVCHPKYANEYKPWTDYRASNMPQELHAIIQNAVIESVELTANKCTLHLSKNNKTHLMEFCDTDPRLAPWGGNEKTKESQLTQEIGNYLLFQHERAILWAQ